MITIHTTTKDQAGILCELGARTFTETFSKDNSPADIQMYLENTFSPEKQLAEISDPARHIAIAWDGATPVGYLHLLNGPVDPAVQIEKPIELLRLYVHSGWHGKGVGALLMDKCLQLAKDLGHKSLWLGVWERNIRAQKFYAKYGFKQVGQHVFKLGTDKQTDFIMVKELPEQAVTDSV